MRVVALAATIIAMTGCGTVANTIWLSPEEGGQRVYGGVRADWESLQDAASTPAGNRQSGILKSALDLPLSTIGDTVTLPFTIPCAILRSQSGRTNRSDGPEPQGKPSTTSSGADR